MAWVQRMLTPKNEGPFEAWPALAPTLMPLLKEEVAGLFLPWSTRTRRPLPQGRKSFEMTLGGSSWVQEPQKYHARSLRRFVAKYAAAKEAPWPRRDPDRKRLPSVFVILSEAKDLLPIAIGDEILRCAQDDS
jgi:hypothetical protein